MSVAGGRDKITYRSCLVYSETRIGLAKRERFSDVAQHSTTLRRKTAGHRWRDWARQRLLLRRQNLDHSLFGRRHRWMADRPPGADFSARAGSSLSARKGASR